MDFMQSSFECYKDGMGLTQTKIFNECGFGWENYPIATLTRQQYWFVAILYELQEEGKVVRLPSKKWRLV